MKEGFKLDKTQFSAMSFSEADKTISDTSKKTWQERLEISFYLNSAAYNFSLSSPPGMDKTIFEARTEQYGKYLSK